MDKLLIILEKKWKDKMEKYSYQIIGFWNDQDDLYVNYVITNNETKEDANVCTLLKTDDIENYAVRTDVRDEIKKIIKSEYRNEFELPKTSEIKDITYNIYMELCESENNMLIIEKKDLGRLNLDYKNFRILLREIEKYKLDKFFERDDDALIVYGGLQCCFNDDRVERGVEFER